MNNTVREDLYKALNDLLEEEFEAFKWWLKGIDYNEKPNISTASLEKANRQQVVDLLIQHYGEDAPEVCIHVLQKSNINDVARKLEETLQEVADVDAHQLPDLSEYRNYIKEKFETMKDPNAVPGEYVLLNQRYSKLIILDYHPSKEEREHEILATGRKHHEIISKRAESSTSIETLFNPDKHGLIPKVVVLQGAAGIGKTIMAKKIMFDWASQQLYQDKFNYVFYICCRKMNLHAEAEKNSIAEIISEGWLKCNKSKIQNILKNEEKLLFIIDGFDELKYSFDQPENYFCTDPWKKETVRILLSSLFQKKLLPKSSLIITTRPTALEKLHQYLEHPGYFEILGFSTKEREEYFYNFFGNEEQATEALRFVKQNDTLFTMCVIPLVSWVICTVMKQEMERGKDLQKTPYSLTEIYMLYLSSLLKFHHKESKQDVQTNVKGLCSLAAEGILGGQILFMEEEVKKHILDQGNSLSLFLNQSIFKEDIDCIQIYSFIHLSFQEFFAALFYVLEEGDEHHSQIRNKNLQSLLERHKSFRTDFAVGFRFLFGFLNEEKRMRDLKKKFGWEISPKNKEVMLDWMKNSFENSSYNFFLQKEMFSYLYETQDGNFIKNAVCGITKIDNEYNSEMELMVLSYCIGHCQNLKNLFINRFDFSENENWSLHERYVEDFFEALTELRNLENLCLGRWSYKASCTRHLAEVFKNNQRLKGLYLCPDDIDDRAAELLLEGLQDPDCKIETLTLSGEFLSEFCSRHLAELLRKNQRLRELYLDIYSSDEKTMKLLCNVLKHPKCTIETLGLAGEIMVKSCSRSLAEVFKTKERLRDLELLLHRPDEKTMKLFCDGLSNPECTVKKLKLHEKILTESCCKHVAEVLRKNQRLRELYLGIHNINDKAMELICDGLKHSHCTIQTLELAGTFLTESCSRHVVEVLRKNQRLRELYLDIHFSDDKAAKLLCDGLKHPECTIETLKVHGSMSTSSCRPLAEVFKTNQRLRELELFLNSHDEETMKLLCDGLNNPDCTVKKLKLHGGSLTESCSKHLAEVLRKNQRLRELYLYLYKADNKATELLCNGLKHPQCTIERLRLAGQFLNEFCSSHLAEVLSKNQRLRELYLDINYTDEKAIELLCDGLKHPQCTIETLMLHGEILSVSGSRHLAEVLRENQRLRTLYLSLNNPDDQPMEELCEGLKQPECTIETLELHGEILSESCSRHLAEVFRRNHSLIDLELSFKSPEDKTMELLCGGLNDPECTIKKLKFSGESLSESCSRRLAEVFRGNQSLRQLEVTLRNLDEKTTGLLYEGLKHPVCKIETLQLNGKYIIQNGKWNETFTVESPARTQGRGKRPAEGSLHQPLDAVSSCLLV